MYGFLPSSLERRFMFIRVVVPLAVIVVLALIVFLLVMLHRRHQSVVEREWETEQRKAWKGNCEFDNPETGAKCERQEFHLYNHYHVITSGVMQTW